MGWWIFWYVLFLVASLAVYFFYRVTHRTFVIWAVCWGFVFFGWSWAKDTFPDLHRVLPRALHDWQFKTAAKDDPRALEARKVVEEECRDEETAETVRLKRDLEKYRDLRAKNGVLTSEQQKERDKVIDRLAEIEKKKGECVARVVPAAPRAEPQAPATVPVTLPAPVPAAPPARPKSVSSVPLPPDLAATRQISPAPRAVDGNLRHAIDLDPGEWLNIRATIRQSCTTWRIDAPAQVWLWFEDGRNAGRVVLYEKGQHDMPPSAIRGDTPMVVTIALTPFNERKCAGYWAKGGTWQPLPPAREEQKGAAKVESITDSPSSSR